MNLRKITSLTMLLSFVLCILTSIILYIVPEGRIAYWAEWRLWGLSKSEWGNLHINLGFLFLVAGLLHLFYNWSVVAAYMKNKAREMKIFTSSFNVALILTLVVGLGTYWQIPPLSTILNVGHSFKDAAAKRYGEPPYGHAELSPLHSFFKKAEIDPVKALELLAKAEIIMENDKETIAAIAARNHLTPKALYDIIKPASTAVETSSASFPDEPMAGFGHKTLAEICTEYNLQPAVIVQGLARENITAIPEQTIREIAGSINMDPHAFFIILHRVVTQQNK
ncbi:MAG: DUF4405 domain-containing protein [Proteobacteria bacterium]|nr:DUF4405 domain-containing protein [Pseudomonadota bacterium]MBU1648410.1 DUF4405 domain-containing protein [Pseudomonadota bacterium]MBU1986010.1 DUF4405 domain-containing protein [Pseudomonadota bacterium]